MKYRFPSPGSTVGSATGRSYSWDAGETIEAPEGEFAHMGESDVDVISNGSYRTSDQRAGRDYETAEMRPASDEDEPSGKFYYEEKGAGWYRICYPDGETVEDESPVRGEDKATRIINELNAS